MTTKTFKFRSWPWKNVMGVEHPVTEGAEEAKDALDQYKKVFADFSALIESIPKKKSAVGAASHDDFLKFCEESKCATCDEEQFKQFKPDKKMQMVKLENIQAMQLKPLKKKGPPADIFPGIIAKMTEFIKTWKAEMKATAEKRAKHKAYMAKLTTFFNAVANEELESVTEQLSKEENKFLLNVRNPQKADGTPVMIAARNNKPKSVKYLLDAKCDLVIEDSFQWTALNWAEEQENQEIIKMLEEAGCEMGSAKDSDDSSDSEGDMACAISDALN